MHAKQTQNSKCKAMEHNGNQQLVRHWHHSDGADGRANARSVRRAHGGAREEAGGGRGGEFGAWDQRLAHDGDRQELAAAL